MTPDPMALVEAQHEQQLSMQTVYVVTCVSGEYSDRIEWVGGVFTNRENAIFAAKLQLSLSKAATAEWHIWLVKRAKIVARFPDDSWSLSPETEKAVTDEIGPAPKGGEEEDYYITEVPLDRWGHWYPIVGESGERG